MRKIIIILSFMSFTLSISAQQNIEWHAYTQLRATSNFNDYNSFMLRRLKFWLKGKPDFSENLSFKVQAIFTSWAHEKFFLQDVKINYRMGQFSLDMGQFVPQYSLQRFQPDYLIAPIERAKVVDVLIPNGALGVRDIGLQANYKSKNKLFETHLGVFNGYGIKDYRFGEHGYMISHKSTVNIPLQKNKIKLGYSLMYRHAKDLPLRFIFPDSVRYSGNDFRYNVFAQFKTPHFNLQAEFLNADFDGRHAYGFYALTSYRFHKHQVIFSYEDYTDLIDKTLNKPYARVGYNYWIKDHRLELSFDNYFRINGHGLDNYYASIELQIFLK